MESNHLFNLTKIVLYHLTTRAWLGDLGFEPRPKTWQGYKDSNLGMPESKSGALDQLGDTPIYTLLDSSASIDLHSCLYFFRQMYSSDYDS